MFIRASVPLCVGCIAALACGPPHTETSSEERSPSRRAEEPRELPEGEWDDHRLEYTVKDRLEGLPSDRRMAARLSFTPQTHDGAKLVVDGAGWPDETIIEVLGATLGPGDDFTFTQTLDYQAALGGAPLQWSQSDRRTLSNDPVDLGIDIVVKVPGYQARTLSLPPVSIGFAMHDILPRITSGPMAFGDEPSNSTVIDAAFYLPISSKNVLVACPSCEAGAEKVYGDVDWVAIAEYQRSEQTKTCAYQRGPVTMSLGKAEVRIYDRRTGDLVAEKTFPGSARCPKEALSSSTERTMTAKVDAEGMRTWVDQQLASAK